jgi:dihydroorotate dehydrogenase
MFEIAKQTDPFARQRLTIDGEGLGDDYVELMQRLSPYADYLVINISSPNTPNLRLLQVRPSLTRGIDDRSVTDRPLLLLSS